MSSKSRGRGRGLRPEGHPFTGSDGLDIITSVYGYLFIFVAGLMQLYPSHEPRGADTEPQPAYGGQAHG